MANKPSKSNSSYSRNSSSKPMPASTSARNTPIPRPNAGRREVTHEMIAKRAFEIHMSGRGGSQLDNWFRAERELKGQ